MFRLDDDTLAFICEGFHIPAKPQALTDIQELANQGDRDLNKAAEIVATDVELAGVILKTINSPLFGLKRKVADIRQATIVLGFDNVYQVAMACLLKHAFKGNSSISLERFWDEAIETAMICSNITITQPVEISAPEAYALGLFHDCGIAAMSIKYEDYRHVLEKVNSSGVVELDKVEQVTYSTAHTHIGYVIAESWGLPEAICELIGRHHESEVLYKLDTDQKCQLQAILFVAQNIMEKKRNGHDLSFWHEIQTHVFSILQMTEKDYLGYLDDAMSPG